MMSNQLKYDTLHEVSAKLNQDLNCIPVLYGSLGLSFALNLDLKTDDIDLLIEDAIFTTKLVDIHHLMSDLGFVLTNTSENEFQRGQIKIGIASDGDMLSFSGIDPTKLTITHSNAKYRVLSAQQYLATYHASSLDGYRKDTKQKDDQSKIDLIESWLHKNHDKNPIQD